MFNPLYLVYSNPAERNQRELSNEGKRIEQEIRNIVKQAMRGKVIII